MERMKIIFLKTVLFDMILKREER